MKKIFFVLLLLPAVCFASDPCEDNNYDNHDSWALTLNNGDNGSKEDLILSLKLLGNKGFSITNILPHYNEKELRIGFEFDIQAYSDSSLGSLEGMRIKNMVIRRLQAINANLLECKE